MLAGSYNIMGSLSGRGDIGCCDEKSAASIQKPFLFSTSRSYLTMLSVLSGELAKLMEELNSSSELQIFWFSLEGGAAMNPKTECPMMKPITCQKLPDPMLFVYAFCSVDRPIVQWSLACHFASQMEMSHLSWHMTHEWPWPLRHFILRMGLGMVWGTGKPSWSWE